MTLIQKTQNVLSSESFKNKIETLFLGDAKKVEAFKSNIIKIVSGMKITEQSLPSVIQSSITIAELDLNLNPALNLCYIVNYRGDYKPVISYKGYVALAERAGKLIKAEPVFKCDDFEMISEGFKDSVRFVRNFNERAEHDKAWYEANFTGVLIRIKDTTTGEVFIHFVSKNKIYKIAGVSPAFKSSSSPYSMWWEEMHLAKAVKYILSKTQITDTILKAVAIDNELDSELVEDNSKNIKRTFATEAPADIDLIESIVPDVEVLDEK